MTTKRQVFYSFHYKPDNWRASQVRNMGIVEGNKSVSDNKWETIKSKGNNAIEKWVDDQMKYRSCTVVLVGESTANRKWINYEIVQSWKNKMGIVGIYIHGLKDSNGCISKKGYNPFDYINYDNEKKLSQVVKCYNPQGNNSKERYSWIEENLSKVIEDAIEIRNQN